MIKAGHFRVRHNSAAMGRLTSHSIGVLQASHQNRRAVVGEFGCAGIGSGSTAKGLVGATTSTRAESNDYGYFYGYSA